MASRVLMFFDLGSIYTSGFTLENHSSTLTFTHFMCIKV